MDLDELAKAALTLPEPWVAEGAALREGVKEVEVRVRYGAKQAPCPKCKEMCSIHDSVERSWRHLDLWDHQTWIVCRVPRVSCDEHKVLRIDVPWADGWARFTAQFECHVIDWLKEASMTATARNLGLSWDQVSGIQSRAVKRGLARREATTPTRVGVDETSFQKRHEYVTIVTDLDTSRGKESLSGFFEGLDTKHRKALQVVAMDMHMPFIVSAAEYVPGIEKKLCFDRFHVAQLFSKAIDKTRRAEVKRQAKNGDKALSGTRHWWLKARKNLSVKLRRRVESLLEKAGVLGDVWTVKEAASKLWSYKSRTWAKKAWVSLCGAAREIDAPALQDAIDTVLRHLLGILNAIVHKVSNAASESVNARVQSLKRRANGYRDRARFRDAIMFHLGGLNLYPRHAIPLKSQ